MGTSFVRVGDRGFWMHDDILELWLRFLSLHVEEPTVPGSVASAIRDQWLLASRGYFMGCVPDGLNDTVASPEGVALVRAAIGSLLAALASGPTHLDKGTLNLMGFEGEFTSDIETRRLVEVGHAFLGLIDGTVGSHPSDSSFMPGST